VAQLSERLPLLCGTTTRRAAACGAVALVEVGWSPRIARPGIGRGESRWSALGHPNDCAEKG